MRKILFTLVAIITLSYSNCLQDHEYYDIDCSNFDPADYMTGTSSATCYPTATAMIEDYPCLNLGDFQFPEHAQIAYIDLTNTNCLFESCLPTQNACDLRVAEVEATCAENEILTGVCYLSANNSITYENLICQTLDATCLEYDTHFALYPPTCDGIEYYNCETVADQAVVTYTCSDENATSTNNFDDSNIINQIDNVGLDIQNKIDTQTANIENKIDTQTATITDSVIGAIGGQLGGMSSSILNNFDSQNLQLDDIQMEVLNNYDIAIDTQNIIEDEIAMISDDITPELQNINDNIGDLKVDTEDILSNLDTYKEQILGEIQNFGDDLTTDFIHTFGLISTVLTNLGRVESKQDDTLDKVDLISNQLTLVEQNITDELSKMCTCPDGFTPYYDSFYKTSKCVNDEDELIELPCGSGGVSDIEQTKIAINDLNVTTNQGFILAKSNQIESDINDLNNSISTLSEDLQDINFTTDSNDSFDSTSLIDSIQTALGLDSSLDTTTQDFINQNDDFNVTSVDTSVIEGYLDEFVTFKENLIENYETLSTMINDTKDTVDNDGLTALAFSTEAVESCPYEFNYKMYANDTEKTLTIDFCENLAPIHNILHLFFYLLFSVGFIVLIIKSIAYFAKD